jgi:phosphoribosylformylglycinamidine synthase I
MKAKALILAGFGINGDGDMAQSFRQVGAEAEVVHIEDLISGAKSLKNYQILGFPGGFAYADDLGAGVALANRLRNNLWEELQAFVERETLTIGICNGFQMMVNLGILPGLPGKMWERSTALRHNKVGMYQCRWVNVKRETEKCIWLKDIEMLPLNIGHGEGNFYCDETTLAALKGNGQVALRYCDENGQVAGGEYPLNPNGSLEDIAGICDASGRILGLMPHPDRFLTAYNENLWTLKKETAKRSGELFGDKSPAEQVFGNAVKFFS